MISMLVQDWLQELGYETVGPAQSVAAALSLLECSPLDGAILDVSLGDDNCYAVADHLLARGVPFAFATGHGRNGIAARFKDIAVLPKPFDFVMMRRVLSELTAKAPGSTAAAITPLAAPPGPE
jgi:CheY-like chemotaxis protein